MTGPAPKARNVRDALERIVASPTFARSDRAKALLNYLVSEQLAGRSDRLKGFSIAVDVFGKDSDYDSSTDAIVRVQAGRLRDLLDQYYAGEGVSETLRIEIPRGGYAPVYTQLAADKPVAAPTMEPIVVAVSAPSLGETPLPTALPAPQRNPGRRSLSQYLVRQVRMFWAAFAVVFAMLFFVAWNSWRESGLDMSITATAAPATRIAEAVVSLPNVFLQSGDDEASRKASAVLRSAVTGFDTVVYIAREAPASGDAAAQDFAFRVAPGPVDGSVSLTFENIRGGQVIASRVLPKEALSPEHIDDAIADVVTATLPVSGALYSYIEAQGLQRGLTRCLLLDDDYYLDQSSAKHKAAYSCFEQLQQAGAHSPLIFAEMAALQLEAVTDKYSYPADASMEKGLQFARHAVQMAPTSPYAHRAAGFLCTRMGMEGEALKWMKKASELGRYDLTMAAAYGYALIMAGDYAQGSPVMAHAVASSSAHPSWWDYTLFLGAYAMGDTQLASQASDSLTATTRPHYLAARLITAAQRNDANSADRLRSELIAKHKNFVSDPRAYYKRAGYPADMIDTLVQGLSAAGLADQS